LDDFALYSTIYDHVALLTYSISTLIAARIAYSAFVFAIY